METLQKLALLTENMSLEPAEEVQLGLPASPQSGSTDDWKTPSGCHPGIFQASLPGGQKLPVLKSLLTSACERNCYYCPFRAGRDMQRATFKPDEMATLFDQMQRKGYVKGLFLSSGIAGGGVRVQDKLIDTIEIIRKRYSFRGYIHLKLIPGSERDQVLRAMQLADRVSVNLEAPNPQRLSRLAPLKTFVTELLEPLRWVEDIRQTRIPAGTWNGRWPSLVTQFVVGPAGESDLELMTTSADLFRRLRLARVYYSAFKPSEDTPFEHLPPENPLREFRLYQASFLLRDYEFDLEDLPFQPTGQLPLDRDPKQAWAEQNLRQAPLELNTADRRSLLRIPGIGPKGANQILTTRRRNPVKSLDDLRRLGVAAGRALPFILLNGRRPTFQLRLW